MSGMTRLSLRRLRQWAIRADVPCRVTTFSPDVKCARQKERFASKLSQDTTSPPHPGRRERYRLKEKRKAVVMTQNATPVSEDEMVKSGQHHKLSPPTAPLNRHSVTSPRLTMTHYRCTENGRVRLKPQTACGCYCMTVWPYCEMSAGTDVRAGGNFLQYLTLQMVLTVGCCWFRIAEMGAQVCYGVYL
eukprot:gene13275-16191_t